MSSNGDRIPLNLLNYNHFHILLRILSWFYGIIFDIISDIIIDFNQ